jgi:hypothetical protein
MRELFLSDQRVIRNILFRYRTYEFERFENVVTEHYSPSRTSSKSRFNLDFYLQFVEDCEIKNCQSFCARVLPNTLGAEVFLTVDEETSRPLRIELLCGEAFPIRFFGDFVQQVENKLTQLSVSVKLDRCAYCRIFVIEDDICFLAFPKEPTPIARGESHLLDVGTESSIACRIDAGDIVCVDGWIRTIVGDSEWKLVAVRENASGDTHNS